MKFDKSRVYTVLNADELKIGSKVIVADDLLALKESVLKHRLPKTIEKVESEDCERRFLCDDGFHYTLAYLVEEHVEKKLECSEKMEEYELTIVFKSESPFYEIRGFLINNLLDKFENLQVWNLKRKKVEE